MARAGLKIDFQFVPMPIEAFDPGRPLREAGIRLLAYILKHTRFGEAFPEVTYEELLNGIIDTRTGRRKDSGCGLSRNGIKHGQTELEERGWLEANNLSTDRSRPRWKYRLILSDREVSPSDNALSRNDSGRKSEVVSRPDNALSPSDYETVTSCEVQAQNDKCNKEEESTKNLDKELETPKAEITAAPVSQTSEQRRQKQMNLDTMDLRRYQDELKRLQQPGSHADENENARTAAYRAGLTPERHIQLLKKFWPQDAWIDAIYPKPPLFETEVAS